MLNVIIGQSQQRPGRRAGRRRPCTTLLAMRGGEIPAVAGTRDELAVALAAIKAESAVVMTMGALHDGHVALMRAARDRVGADGQRSEERRVGEGWCAR